MIDKKHEQHKKGGAQGSRGWQKQVSWMLSGAVLACFFVFMTGYFVGQHRALYLFTQKIEQESLQDQIYSSLCALYDTDEGDAQANLLPQASDEMALDDHNTEYGQWPEVAVQSIPQQSTESDAGSSYYAQLIGFGTYKAAERFVSRLAQKDIKAIIKKTSKQNYLRESALLVSGCH